MDLLRKNLWLWVIIGVIVFSVVISIIFLLINKCISRSGKHRVSHLQRRHEFAVNSNKYQERNLKADIPPLPPRTQFLTAAQSYENLAEAPNYKQSMPDYQQDKHDYEESTPDYEQDKHDYEESMLDNEQDKHDYEESTPDYEQDKHDYEESMLDYEQDKHDYEESTPDYEQDKHDYEESTPDYEQDKHDYEQSLDEQPDYVKVEDEQMILPPPQLYKDPDPAADDVSMDDYDDIGGEDDVQGEEDYDDVG